MSRWPLPRVIAALAVALLVSWTAESRAQSVMPGEDAEQARLAKARTISEQKRSTVERLIFKLDDDLLLDRVLDAPRGFYVRLGGIGEGASFGAGPAFRYNATRFDFKSSAVGTIKKYFLAEGTLRFPGTIGHNEYIRPRGPYFELYGRHRDFPQEDFFGLGPDSQEAQRSNYAQRDNFGSVTPGFETRRLKTGVGVGYLEVSIGDGTDTRMPSSTDIFTPEEMPGVADQPAFVVVQPFLEFRTVDRSVNDRAGGIYRFSAARYRDQELARYSFDRYEADLRHYFSFVKDTRTIALRAWAASTTPDDGQEVPFYMQPTIGGARTLRGYRTFRYRDRSAVLLQAEYRWRINEFVTGALFYDTGAVGATLDGLGRFERNYGIGLRAGNRMGSAFRFEFAFGGREGNRVLVRFDDAF